MKFPVFLLGLIVSSFCIGVVLWIMGVPIGMSLLWALIAFGIGQLLYVVLVALMAAKEQKASGTTSKADSVDAAKTTQRLEPQQDRQG
jgi:hypothetical protein